MWSPHLSARWSRTRMDLTNYEPPIYLALAKMTKRRVGFPAGLRPRGALNPLASRPVGSYNPCHHTEPSFSGKPHVHRRSRLPTRPRCLEEAELAWRTLCRLDVEHLRVKEAVAAHEWRAAPAGTRQLAFGLLNEVVKWKLYLDWHIEAIAPATCLSLILNSGDDAHRTSLRNLLRIVVYGAKNPAASWQEDLFPAVEAIAGREALLLRRVLPEFLRVLTRVSVEDLRRTAQSAEYLSVKFSHPEWMVRRWLARFDEETVVELLEQNNRHDPVVFRVSQISRQELRRRLEFEGVTTRDANFHPRCLIVESFGGHRIAELQSYREGLFQVHAEMPAWVVDILDPCPGDHVLDMCCLPGTKTSHIAETMGTGSIDAVDNRPDQAPEYRDMIQNFDRLRILEKEGLKVNFVSIDGAKFNPPSPYDKILIDAPCSGLGILSRHSDARWHRSDDDTRRWSPVQRGLLNNCAGLLKVGGRLVYSTCTIEPDENEYQIRDFLVSNPNFHLEALSGRIPGVLLRGDYYYPMKFLAPTKGKIQSGFAASLIRHCAT